MKDLTVLVLTFSVITIRKLKNTRCNRCEPYANLHGPFIKFNSLNPYELAGIAIRNNGAVPRNSYIREFITNVESTCTQLNVTS